MTRYWTPALKPFGPSSLSKRPEIDSIIAVNRKPWRVLEVRDHPDADIDYEVFVKPVDDEQHYGFTVRPHAARQWWELPEHYAVCHSCGELAPCRGHEQAQYAADQARQLEHEMRLLPGCCPGCQEPITPRQRSIEFPGEYVLNPLMEPSPRFHLRSKCWSAAARYEEKWVVAWPGRQRSLLTLKCAGTVVVHGDGSAECHGAEDSDCPSVHARHRGMSACYVQSRGCPRGCSTVGHPGTRVAGAPEDPRDIHPTTGGAPR
ncbi:hypothetical protein HMPREF0063_10075 [Aeromicrobium marinum DSM 15272]|uniref:Uncharacterized protein n=1 Tax=Aeromicrobium marinum DSM 15272 TaxID=585531 RepID=E2S7R8_9ACTN|nr:hypothetical protein [Aeromicrobium marinum]EFQ84734.1 hypothetical protein HMPREF0063_10075 [Aeromicrobium marinum DSM 15272]